MEMGSGRLRGVLLARRRGLVQRGQTSPTVSTAWQQDRWRWSWVRTCWLLSGEYRNACSGGPKTTAEITSGCYQVRDPLDLAVIAVAGGGACLGFLWWNAAPAKIFMGDTGSLALGGMLAGLSITTRTELLAVIIGALFVAEIMSVVIQIAFFRTTGAGCSGWLRSTIISNSVAGRRRPSSSDSGC